MNYMREFARFHKLASKAPMPSSWRDASSWKLIAELVRRSPEEFLVYECPYAQGIPDTVWYLNDGPTREEHQGNTRIQINNGGHVNVQRHYSDSHVCEINHGGASKQEERFHSLDMIFSPKPKQIVLEVESCYRGRSLPNHSRETTFRTIGHRVIASALGLFLHTNKPLRVSGFLFDGVHPQEDLLRHFPAFENYNNNSAKLADFDQFFFIREVGIDDENWNSQPGVPILAINLKAGIAYNQRTELNLMPHYIEVNRDIDALAFSLINDARAKAKTA